MMRIMDTWLAAPSFFIQASLRLAPLKNGSGKFYRL